MSASSLVARSRYGEVSCGSPVDLESMCSLPPSAMETRLGKGKNGSPAREWNCGRPSGCGCADHGTLVWADESASCFIHRDAANHAVLPPIEPGLRGTGPFHTVFPLQLEALGPWRSLYFRIF